MGTLIRLQTIPETGLMAAPSDEQAVALVSILDERGNRYLLLVFEPPNESPSPPSPARPKAAAAA